METKVVEGWDTRWKVLEGAWAMGTRGSEFWCCTECNNNKSSGIWIGDKSGNGEQLELNKRTTRQCFLMRRVKTNGEHNKEEVWR